METELVALTWAHPKGSSLPLHPLPFSGMCFSPARPPALTSAEHQAQRGLTARHCLQEFTPRVVQMLPPETAKQSNYSPQNPNSHVCSATSFSSSQSPTRALLYPLCHSQTLGVASLLSPAWYELGFILPKAEHHSHLPAPQRVLSPLQHHVGVGVKPPLWAEGSSTLVPPCRHFGAAGGEEVNSQGCRVVPTALPQIGCLFPPSRLRVVGVTLCRH